MMSRGRPAPKAREKPEGFQGTVKCSGTPEILLKVHSKRAMHLSREETRNVVIDGEGRGPEELKNPEKKYQTTQTSPSRYLTTERNVAAPGMNSRHAIRDVVEHGLKETGVPNFGEVISRSPRKLAELSVSPNR